MTTKKLQSKAIMQMKSLTKKASHTSQRRAKAHVNNETIFRRIEEKKLEIDKQFAEINEKLLAFNKPSVETIAIGTFLAAVLEDPNKHGFTDTGEVIEKLVPLTGV